MIGFFKRFNTLPEQVNENAKNIKTISESVETLVENQVDITQVQIDVEDNKSAIEELNGKVTEQINKTNNLETRTGNLERYSATVEVDIHNMKEKDTDLEERVEVLEQGGGGTGGDTAELEERVSALEDYNKGWQRIITRGESLVANSSKPIYVRINEDKLEYGTFIQIADGDIPFCIGLNDMLEVVVAADPSNPVGSIIGTLPRIDVNADVYQITVPSIMSGSTYSPLYTSDNINIAYIVERVSTVKEITLNEGTSGIVRDGNYYYYNITENGDYIVKIEFNNFDADDAELLINLGYINGGNFGKSLIMGPTLITSVLSSYSSFFHTTEAYIAFTGSTVLDVYLSVHDNYVIVNVPDET